MKKGKKKKKKKENNTGERGLRNGDLFQTYPASSPSW